MDEGQTNQNNLVDTTDCLEAVGVFRGWKNVFFIITILCILVLQASFWLVDTGYIKADTEAQIAPSVPTRQEVAEPNEAVADEITVEQDHIQQAAKKAVTGANSLAEAAPPQPKQKIFRFKLTIEHLTWLIRFFNFVLIPTAILYCLTMLFSLKVSLLGRLGGINHISRAFFISLLALVFLLPWQRFFPGVVAGAMYTPEELLDACAADTSGFFGAFFHYLRFAGYWLLIVLLLICSQFRSARWTKTILRRLEVM
ncbi:MAG: hypothetical protein ACYS1A_06825 [Planctomycetota bacterium]|jgi:hypothetical protein